MDVLTTTPFGQRPVTAGLLEHIRQAQAPVSVPWVDKWSLFRDLCTARAAYGLSDRDLTVLNALLSFHPERNLDDDDQLIVFPSNRTLSERAHGMAESTLRRHLAALVRAGVIQRHDSPNGKRYAARGRGGQVIAAFGFDLRPLLVQAEDITAHAEKTREHEARLKMLRAEITVMKRDALKLMQYGQETNAGTDWSDVEASLLGCHRTSRRKLTEAKLVELKGELARLLKAIRTKLETEKMSGSDIKNERYFHNSNKETFNFKATVKNEEGRGQQPEKPNYSDEVDIIENERTPNLPLQLVIKACPDILPYSDVDINHWHQLIALAGFVRGMMGITQTTWHKAQSAMGPEVAAITVAAILQRVNDIKNPSGYLQSLSAKAKQSAFSPAPMIIALLNSQQS